MVPLETDGSAVEIVVVVVVVEVGVDVAVVVVVLFVSEATGESVSFPSRLGMLARLVTLASPRDKKRKGTLAWSADRLRVRLDEPVMLGSGGFVLGLLNAAGLL